MTFDRIDGHKDMTDVGTQLSVQITAEENSQYVKSKFQKDDWVPVPQTDLKLVEPSSLKDQKSVWRAELGLSGIFNNAAGDSRLSAPGEVKPGGSDVAKVGEGALNEICRWLNKLDSAYGKELMQRGDAEKLHKLASRKTPEGMADLAQDLSGMKVRIDITPNAMVVTRNSKWTNGVETLEVRFDKNGDINKGHHLERGWFGFDTASDLEKAEVQKVFQDLMRRSAK